MYIGFWEFCRAKFVLCELAIDSNFRNNSSPHLKFCFRQPLWLRCAITVYRILQQLPN